MNSGVSSIVAGIIVAVGIVAGAVMIKGSIDQNTMLVEVQADEIRTALADLETAVKEGAPPARAAAPSRPNRPDPNKRYTVKTDGAPVMGSETAKVTVVEFSDFQCPFCSRVTPTLVQLQKDYPEDVKVVFKHLPLTSIHPRAPAAHAAAEAAHRQGKFWPMHDKIFANQRDLADETFIRYATELGLDVDQFKKDLVSDDVKSRVTADSREAQGLGVSGTPSFFINGKYLSGAQPLEAFKAAVDEELKAEG